MIGSHELKIKISFDKLKIPRSTDFFYQHIYQ